MSRWRERLENRDAAWLRVAVRAAEVCQPRDHHTIARASAQEAEHGQFFLTMELVEGRSLADALPKGGLPIDRLLKIAIPMADAVAAAHQKGITHRDLKPANIMIGEGDHDGRVKVLDFGLAKLTDAPLAAEGATALPTAPITGEGRILGTVAYMSPEQAEGKPIDARSDLFSLGVILFELATGARPFTGETSMSILSSIIKDTPKSITEINPVLPRDLGRIVRRALVKDPTRRYQTAADLRNDLEELKASLDSGELLVDTSVSGTSPRSGGVPGGLGGLGGSVTRHPRLAVTGGIVALTVAAAGIYAFVQRRPQPIVSSPAATSPLQDFQITQLTTSGNATRPAVSPDGKYVAYVQQDGTDFSLWIRQTTTASNVQIVRPEADVQLLGATVTPDGSVVDFVRRKTGAASPELWRVPFLGGTPRRLVDNAWSAVGWSPDGQHMALVREPDSAKSSDALMIADADGSHERVLAVRRLPTQFISLAIARGAISGPAWSPDGRVIALSGNEAGGGRASQQVVVVDVASGSERTIAVPGGQPGSVAWLDDGSLALSQPSEAGGPAQLWRLSYSDGRLPRLSNDLSNYSGVSLTTDRASLVTVQSATRVAIWAGDGTGAQGTEVIASAQLATSLAWAGDHLLYVDTRGRPSIWKVTADQGTPEELGLNGNAPAATSDGRTIVFVSQEAGRIGLWKVDADGRHPVQLAPGETFGPVVTADDRQVIFSSSRNGVQSPWIVSIDGGSPPAQIANVFAGFPGVDISPDGKSIVFPSQDDQNETVIVCNPSDCSARKSVALRRAPRGRVRWTPDGRARAFTDVATQSNLWAQPLDGKPSYQLTHFTDSRRIADFVWSHDGKRLALARPTITSDIVLFKSLKR